MAAPALDLDKFLAELNETKNGGVIVTNEILLRNLSRKIAAVKTEDIAAYHCHMASLHSLKGDVEALRDSIRITRAIGDTDARSVYLIQTLLVCGLFSEASQLASEVWPIACPDMARLARILFGMFRHDLLSEFEEGIAMGKDVESALAVAGAAQNDVLPMLDLAGKVMLRHGFLTVYPPEVFSDERFKMLSIHIPVIASPTQAAEMEWEFCERLFAELPGAPTATVQVGFCTHEA